MQTNKRTSDAIKDGGEFEATVAKQRRLTEEKENVDDEMTNTSAEQHKISNLEFLRQRVAKTLEAMEDMELVNDPLQVFSAKIMALSKIDAGKHATELTITESEWGQTKLDIIHATVNEMNAVIQMHKRRQMAPPIHAHTSPQCTVCRGCLQHLEETIVRQVLQYHESKESGDNFRFQRGRRGFFNRGTASRGGRHGSRGSIITE